MDIRIIAKNIIKGIIPVRIKNILTHESTLQAKYAQSSYAQEGEDILIDRLFNCKPDGFFVDVGAHHPMRFSNTYMLYNRGWKGINIEPNPDILNLFQEFRSRDINLNVGISENEASLKYYTFKEPALNTFSEKIKEERVRNSSSELTSTLSIPTMPLAKILELHKDIFSQIDFMTIDTEGFDLQVLKSNDWQKYSPKLLLVEMTNTDIEGLNDSEMHQFIVSKKYKLISKTKNTFFYSKIE